MARKKKVEVEVEEPVEPVEEAQPVPEPEPEPEPIPEPEPVVEEVVEDKVVDVDPNLIMIKKSPSYRQYRGNPLELEGNEVVAVDQTDRRVRDMLRCGNAQLVSNIVRGKPRVIPRID